MSEFAELSPTTLAEVLGRAQVMDHGIRPLWQPIPRIAGPAYPVVCPPGENLMLHAAIYRAPRGSVVVAQGGDLDYALAGGNVCAIAQRNGIAGFVVDGVIRDVAEVREMAFPVFARGLSPAPGTKRTAAAPAEQATVGGVVVRAGDVVVADEEGVAVVPADRAADVLEAARARVAAEDAQTLDDWEAQHRATVDAALRAGGYDL